MLALPRLGPQQLDDLQEPGGCRRREELACSWLVEDTWVPQHRFESTPGMVTSLTGPVWSAGRPRLWEESRSGESGSRTDTVTGREERITWVGEDDDLVSHAFLELVILLALVTWLHLSSSMCSSSGLGCLSSSMWETPTYTAGATIYQPVSPTFPWQLSAIHQDRVAVPCSLSSRADTRCCPECCCMWSHLAKW